MPRFSGGRTNSAEAGSRRDEPPLSPRLCPPSGTGGGYRFPHRKPRRSHLYSFTSPALPAYPILSIRLIYSSSFSLFSSLFSVFLIILCFPHYSLFSPFSSLSLFRSSLFLHGIPEFPLAAFACWLRAAQKTGGKREFRDNVYKRSFNENQKEFF
jgi:hypothetical protein